MATAILRNKISNYPHDPSHDYRSRLIGVASSVGPASDCSQDTTRSTSPYLMTPQDVFLDTLSDLMYGHKWYDRERKALACEITEMLLADEKTQAKMMEEGTGLFTIRSGLQSLPLDDARRLASGWKAAVEAYSVLRQSQVQGALPRSSVYI